MATDEFRLLSKFHAVWHPSSVYRKPFLLSSVRLTLSCSLMDTRQQSRTTLAGRHASQHTQSGRGRAGNVFCGSPASTRSKSEGLLVSAPDMQFRPGRYVVKHNVLSARSPLPCIFGSSDRVAVVSIQFHFPRRRRALFLLRVLTDFLVLHRDLVFLFALCSCVMVQDGAATLGSGLPLYLQEIS